MASSNRSKQSSDADVSLFVDDERQNVGATEISKTLAICVKLNDLFLVWRINAGVGMNSTRLKPGKRSAQINAKIIKLRVHNGQHEV